MHPPPPDHMPEAEADLLAERAAQYEEAGRYAEAEPLYARALAISMQVYGAESAEVACLQTSLADVYRASGKYAEAEPLYRQALRTFEQVDGPEHPDVANLLTKLGSLCLQRGDHTGAEPLLRRARDTTAALLRPVRMAAH